MATIAAIRHLAFENLGILEPLFAQRGDHVFYLDAPVADFTDPRLADADLPLWDHLDPPSFGAGAAPGYWALFPERLRAALAELDGTR